MATKAQPAAKKTGSTQRAASTKAAQREPASLIPRGERSVFRLEPADFRVSHTGANGVRRVLSPLSTSLTWSEDSSSSGGSIALSQHDDDGVRLEHGDRLLVEAAAPGDRMKPLWAMRTVEPQQSLEGMGASAQLETDLGVLQRFKRDWRYQRDRRHPHGWYAHQIVADVCRQAGVASATLVKAKTPQTITKRYASAVDIIIAAYRKERQETGSRFLVDMRGGRVNIRTPKRSGSVAVFGPLVRSATITRRWPKGFATELIVTARIGKRQVQMTVPNTPLVRRYGRVTAKATYGEMASRTAVRARARRDLAERSMMVKEVSFTHPGVLTLSRGQQIVLELPGYTFGFPLFVASLSHSISSGDHEMQVDCTFDDPIPDSAGDKIKAQNSRDTKKTASSSSTAKAKQRLQKAAA